MPLRRPTRLRRCLAGKSIDSLLVWAMNQLRVPIYRNGIGLGCSAPAPPSMVSVPHASALIHRAALQWHLTPYGQSLPDPAYSCGYTIAASNRPCGTPLDVYAQHSSTCSKGPIRYRHDSIKHTWPRLIRLAGWHVTVEQSVTLSSAGTSSTKKADLIAMSPGGSCYALDIMVTQGSMSTLSHADLATAEADKCRQYKLSQAGDSLPGGDKLFPLVHHGTGMMSSSAFDFANLILKDMATKSAVADGTVLQTAAIGRAREMIFLSLTYVQMRTQYRMYRACGPTL
eukprot:1246462-Amphidinium_carterae.2